MPHVHSILAPRMWTVAGYHLTRPAHVPAEDKKGGWSSDPLSHEKGQCTFTSQMLDATSGKRPCVQRVPERGSTAKVLTLGDFVACEHLF